MLLLYPCRLPVMTQRLLCLSMTSLCKCVFLMWSRSASFEEFSRHCCFHTVSQGVLCVSVLCVCWGGESQSDSAVHIIYQIGPAGRNKEESLHNIFPTVTSVSLASGQPAGAKGGSGFPLQCLCGLSLPHH